MTDQQISEIIEYILNSIAKVKLIKFPRSMSLHRDNCHWYISSHTEVVTALRSKLEDMGVIPLSEQKFMALIQAALNSFGECQIIIVDDSPGKIVLKTDGYFLHITWGDEVAKNYPYADNAPYFALTDIWRTLTSRENKYVIQ